MKEIICIVCPKGCHIKVDEDNNISGYSCPRGLQYAQNEITCPQRTLTSTVKIISTEIARLPVASNGDIPKNMMFAIMDELAKIEVKAPIKLYDVIIKNVLQTGVDIIATRSIYK